MRLLSPEGTPQGTPALAPLVVGPCCTDSGRFWLRLRPEPAKVTEALRVLIIIPVTYSDWANPWHHFHWWIPALWHIKFVLELEPEDTEVALVFSNEDAEWGVSARTRPTDTLRQEPAEWNFLQDRWPRQRNEPAWKPGGLHDDVLRWLSDKAARPLSEVYGQAFRKVVVGVPPVRFTVQTPQVTCVEVAAVRAWLLRTAEYARAAAASPLAGSGAGGGDGAEVGRRLRRLSVIQRPLASGRVISNVEELISALNRKFADKLVARVLPDLSGLTWTAQFLLFARSDVVVGAPGAALGWLWALRRGAAAIELRASRWPVWTPCSSRWGADAGEMFGGLALLAGVRHICVRSSWPPLEEAGGSDVEWKPLPARFDRGAEVVADVSVVQELVRQALTMMQGEPPLCETFHRELL